MQDGLLMVSILLSSAGMIVNVAPAHIYAMQAASVTQIDTFSACSCLAGVSMSRLKFCCP